MDWGWYPDPVSLVALYYYNGGYIVDEVVHGTNLDDEFVASEIKKVVGWADTYVVCGADEPKSIEMLRRNKVRAEATDNRKGSVNVRIKTTSTKKIMVTKRSKNVWAGYEVYRWAEDKDGNPKGVPDHDGSDAMDAVSYAILSMHNKQLDIVVQQPPKPKVNQGL